MRIEKYYIVFALILFSIFLFRLPSLYEPFWYGDEGIFAAVARNLNQGGVLYKTAWDNKPPMIYLTYQAIFATFGVSMFWLRLVTMVAVMATASVIYEIGEAVFSKKRALVAAFAFGFLSSLRIVEGNLALTEIFLVLFTSLAMLFVIKRKFDYVSLFFAGFLLAVASLYKQVGALEAGALGTFIFLSAKNFGEFVKKGLVLTLGFLAPFAVFIAYFVPKHLVGEYIFASYTYYRIYLKESPRLATLINVLKYTPALAAIVYGLWKKKRGELTTFHLFLLWAAFSFLGSYFSGRAYGHYIVQALPATSLLLASVAIPRRILRAQVGFAIFFFVPLIFLTKLLFTDFLSGGPINQVKYWGNFTSYMTGGKSLSVYNDYFDQNVNRIDTLSYFFKMQKDSNKSAYIWGDLPWLYAAADLKNPTRYVTSFHVFGVPKGREEVVGALEANLPRFILKPPSSTGYFAELEKIIASGYTLHSTVEGVDIYVKKGAIWQIAN